MSASQLSELVDHHGRAVVDMLSGGIDHMVAGYGGVFLGITIRGCSEDSLVIIRADFEGVVMVAFAGGSNGVSALRAAQRELKKGSAVWKPCRYTKPRRAP